MQTKTCCWLLDVNGKNVRCDKITAYKMILEDDGRRYRKYEPFCEHHKEVAEKQRKLDELDEESF